MKTLVLSLLDVVIFYYLESGPRIQRFGISYTIPISTYIHYDQKNNGDAKKSLEGWLYITVIQATVCVTQVWCDANIYIHTFIQTHM